VVVQCAVLNRFRRRRFSLTDQFVLSYGGLRGAIAFGLVISTRSFPARQMFITTTLAVIFFTVFVQGITIRPLLYWLKVEKQEMQTEDGEMMAEKIFGRVRNN
jgi:NhaP-type Na+/H+ or K+/H+ antiporter